MDAVAELNHWMITEGRRSGDPIRVVSHFCSALSKAGVPLWRVNIGQRFANPLLIAWGVVWTPDGTESYDVTHARMLTDGYIGSAFEYILKNQRPLHKSLRGLDPAKDHISFLEFAEAGGTDYYATLLDYGDGSQHGCTFATRAPDGFADQHLAMIEAAKPGLSLGDGTHHHAQVHPQPVADLSRRRSVRGGLERLNPARGTDHA